MRSIALWGGVECTVNRVGDRWHDQLEIGGHAQRVDDLDLIAALGIRTLRYPILWERIAPASPGQRLWNWADQRLTKLRSLSVEPIVGLVHHGSGPRYTGLLNDNFASGLAQFAFDVAQRFPWITQYTPVNEPLTTARFSSLYGHWYPHHRDDRSFARALINQCRATVLSMTAIRRVNPAAELVQTEDFGTTYSTPHMAYQRIFDNERRWLTWDILCGRVDQHHRLRPFLERCGIPAEELDWFLDYPCPPQVLGINHYVTSDRYLDEHLPGYPQATHGHNGREPYADADAVRVLPNNDAPWSSIQEVASRYDLPVALTEVHLGCTREEQLRWFHGCWTAAIAAQRDGCDVRAVTAWSLFGCHNWDNLLTRTGGSYEPGAFDVRGPCPRPTAVAKLICKAISGAATLEPQFDSVGWWQRPDRVLYGDAKVLNTGDPIPCSTRRSRPLLICGARGALGHAFIRACEKRNLHYIALSRSDLENGDRAAVDAILAEVKPWAIVNAAGYVRVDDAERQQKQCFHDNLNGPEALAAASHQRAIPFVTFSSDLVFDGLLVEPYTESSLTAPLNVYGRSKVASEAATLLFPTTLCIRTSAFFGASPQGDFLTDGLIALQSQKTYVALNDVTVSPTYLPDLADASLDLLIDGCTGLIHLANRGAVTWSGFVEQGAKAVGVDIGTLERCGLEELMLSAPRPRYSALASERVGVMPTLDDAIYRYAYDARNGRGHQLLRR